MIFAKSKTQANNLAKEYFRKHFKLKGNIGLENMSKGNCGCNDSLFLEYYSKDDSTITQLFEVTICKHCYENQLVPEVVFETNIN
jgi:hypothetical protein